MGQLHQETRKQKYKEMRRQEKVKLIVKIGFIAVSVMGMFIYALLPNTISIQKPKSLQTEQVVAAESLHRSIIDTKGALKKSTKSNEKAFQTVSKIKPKYNVIILNHKVNKGETIYSISKTYFKSNKTAKILSFNRITKPEEEVKVGMILEIPNPDNLATHSVKKGETLFSITNQYFNRGQLLSYIMNYNRIDDPSIDVKAGMKIFIPSNDSVISHSVKEKETLYSIMNKYYSLANFQKEVASFNDIHNVSTDIKVGMVLKIPNIFIGETSTSNERIEINTAKNVLTYYKDNKVIFTTKIATGKNDLTPKGAFEIVTKFKNPYYSPKKIKGGAPNNPLGTRWLGLSVEGTQGRIYGIHGTNAPSSIGSNASIGCIRMDNKQVEWLFDQVSIGTSVVVK